jgi:hypothetical protein
LSWPKTEIVAIDRTIAAAANIMVRKGKVVLLGFGAEFTNADCNIVKGRTAFAPMS